MLYSMRITDFESRGWMCAWWSHVQCTYLGRPFVFDSGYALCVAGPVAGLLYQCILRRSCKSGEGTCSDVAPPATLALVGVGQLWHQFCCIMTFVIIGNAVLVGMPAVIAVKAMLSLIIGYTFMATCDPVC